MARLASLQTFLQGFLNMRAVPMTFEMSEIPQCARSEVHRTCICIAAF
jgi:hypothetical protein